MTQGLEMWLFAARAVFLCAAFASFAWALLRLRRDSALQHAQVLAAQRESTEQLQAQMQALTERVGMLGTILATLRERSERPVEAPPPPRAAPRREPGARSYETAKRLARSGATVEEIVATCGVAGTEARLLRRLHGADSHAGNAA